MTALHFTLWEHIPTELIPLPRHFPQISSNFLNWLPPYLWTVDLKWWLELLGRKETPVCRKMVILSCSCNIMVWSLVSGLLTGWIQDISMASGSVLFQAWVLVSLVMLSSLVLGGVWNNAIYLSGSLAFMPGGTCVPQVWEQMPQGGDRACCFMELQNKESGFF